MYTDLIFRIVICVTFFAFIITLFLYNKILENRLNFLEDLAEFDGKMFKAIEDIFYQHDKRLKKLEKKLKKSKK